MKIYAIGLDNDKTLQRFIGQAKKAGHEIILINLHELFKKNYSFSIPAIAGISSIDSNEQLITLDPRGNYFVRLIDLSTVLVQNDAKKWRALITSISVFLETVEGPVVNRPGIQAHNSAKPYHEWWLAKNGFNVAPAITSSDRKELRKFLDQLGTGIVKSLCGSRGTAQKVTIEDFKDFYMEQGPVHIQRYIKGYDLRVHIVGDRVHAEKIICDAADYRSREAKPVYMPEELTDDLKQKMIRTSRKMGLSFSGWDFKVDDQQIYWCLEVNPMPGYDVYDRRAGGEISKSLLNFFEDAGDKNHHSERKKTAAETAF
jgi:glutathione synthase/RimK-type ligase-like ATP-grasp enzyme